MRTLEQFEEELDLLIDSLESDIDMITEESIKRIESEITSFCKKGMREGIFDKMPYIKVDAKEDIGVIDVTVGDQYEESENRTSNSKKRKQTTSTRGESVTRNIR